MERARDWAWLAGLCNSAPDQVLVSNQEKNKGVTGQLAVPDLGMLTLDLDDDIVSSMLLWAGM